MAEQHVIETHAAAGTAHSYRIGFVLSVVLTVTGFAIVLYGEAPRSLVVPLIAAAAVAQVLVHLSYFLHLSTAPEQRWNLLAFAVTALIIGLILAGSLWIMHNLHQQMMGAGAMDFDSRMPHAVGRP
jgi:cytochrome o ubiquinol oxidase operon protein cyoD